MNSRYVRTFILFPYEEVRDHRTGLGTCDIQAVLDGDLDEFITASIILRAKEREDMP